MTNGTLQVYNFVSTGKINFTCNISNQHGSDNRTFTLLIQGKQIEYYTHVCVCVCIHGCVLY